MVGEKEFNGTLLSSVQFFYKPQNAFKKKVYLKMQVWAPLMAFCICEAGALESAFFLVPQMIRVYSKV